MNDDECLSAEQERVRDIIYGELMDVLHNLFT